MRNLNPVFMSTALTLALAAYLGCGGTTTSIPSGDGTEMDSDSGIAAADGGSSAEPDGGTTPADSGGQDATTVMPGEVTWTYLVGTYFAKGKLGNCVSCHSQLSTPAKAYSYLGGKGYITAGTKPALVSSKSCLSWYGGTMPPGGPSSATAVKDFDAWAAAGSKNN
jgi:hypothetical protein